jgi:hypothetical protein
MENFFSLRHLSILVMGPSIRIRVMGLSIRITESSGSTFIRMLKTVLDPMNNIPESYVDYIAVHSGDFSKVDDNDEKDWESHLAYLGVFLREMFESGLTLNLRKSQFAKPKVKFVGYRPTMHAWVLVGWCWTDKESRV